MDISESRRQAGRGRRAHARAGFTLIEMLVVIVVLGIAGAMVIPSMGQTGILRVQAAVRTIVSDITFAQSDAVAYQEKRAIMFDVPTSSYRILSVPGSTLDPTTNTLYDPQGPEGKYVVDFRGEQFGDSRIVAVSFEGGTSTDLIFDGLGGPVSSPSSDTPGAGGYIDVTGSGSTFRIQVESFTGRVTVTKTAGE